MRKFAATNSKNKGRRIDNDWKTITYLCIYVYVGILIL